MSAVTHGADTERLESVATAIGREADRSLDIALTGSTCMALLQEAWGGADVEHFGRAWTTASHQIDDAAHHLRTAASALRRHALEQRGASEALGAVTIPPSGPPGGTATDDEGSSTADTLGLDKLVVRIPEGLDTDDPVVRDLLQSPEGRAWLLWLADHDITVVVGGTGSSYNSSSDRIYLASDADATTLIHEASHAQWDLAGDRADPTEVGRDEYIASQLDNEVQAMVSEVEYQLATSDSPGLITDQAFISYTEAYDAAIAGGASEEAAGEAGRGAIHELFTYGFYQTSTTGQTYPEYYGDGWDDAQDR